MYGFSERQVFFLEGYVTSMTIAKLKTISVTWGVLV